MSWRPYVISNIYGKKKVMRDTQLYKTKEEAVRSMKIKNNKWMELNYDKNFSKMSNFEYGAIKVGKDGYNFQKGSKGNKKLLDHHISKTKPTINKQFRWF